MGHLYHIGTARGEDVPPPVRLPLLSATMRKTARSSAASPVHAPLAVMEKGAAPESIAKLTN